MDVYCHIFIELLSGIVNWGVKRRSTCSRRLTTIAPYWLPSIIPGTSVTQVILSYPNWWKQDESLVEDAAEPRKVQNTLLIALTIFGTARNVASTPQEVHIRHFSLFLFKSTQTSLQIIFRSLIPFKSQVNTFGIMTTILSKVTPGSTSSSKDTSPNWAAKVDAHTQAATKTIAGPLATFFAEAGGHTPKSEESNNKLKATSLLAAFNGLTAYKHVSDKLEQLRWHTGEATLIQEDWSKTFSYGEQFTNEIQDSLQNTSKSIIATVESMPDAWRSSAAALYLLSLEILVDFYKKVGNSLDQIRVSQANLKAGKWGVIEKGKDAVDGYYKEAVEKIEYLHSHE